MFAELNSGVFGIIALILFIIHFGNKMMKGSLDSYAYSSACCWCIISICVLSAVGGGGATMDSGKMMPQVIGGTYLLCSICLIVSSCIVNFSK